jgi:hypothetical protein
LYQKVGCLAFTKSLKHITSENYTKTIQVYQIPKISYLFEKYKLGYILRTTNKEESKWKFRNIAGQKIWHIPTGEKKLAMRNSIFYSK